MKQGVIKISDVYFKQIFQIPDDVNIKEIKFDYFNGVVELHVEGMGKEVAEGSVPPDIIGICHIKEKEQVIEWEVRE